MKINAFPKLTVRARSSDDIGRWVSTAVGPDREGSGEATSGTCADAPARSACAALYASVYYGHVDGLRPGLNLGLALPIMLLAFIFSLISTAVLTKIDEGGKVVWTKMIVGSGTGVLGDLATNLAASALV